MYNILELIFIIMEDALNTFHFNLALLLGNIIYRILKLFGVGATTLPGKIAITICPKFLKGISKKASHFIFITGTNGKTTTNNLLVQIIKNAGYSVFSNLEGANLRSGIATAYLKNPKHFDYGCIEIDEGVFRLVIKDIKPEIVCITNFFRDQLDRYGEIDTTVNKIIEGIQNEPVKLILNADDPFTTRLSFLGKINSFYGIDQDFENTNLKEIKESVYCPKCGLKLDYIYFNYAQIGKYHCSCGFKTPEYNYSLKKAVFDKVWKFSIFDTAPIENFQFSYAGIYNLYNVTAAYSTARAINIDRKIIQDSVLNFEYRLGRQEKFAIKGFERSLVLVKNPAGFNQVLDMSLRDKDPKTLLLILNDYTADGRDISWIWDVDFEKLLIDQNLVKIICSGSRAFDMLLRLKYAEIPPSKLELIKMIEPAINKAILSKNKTYILPTYTALFYCRKLLLKKQRSKKWN